MRFAKCFSHLLGYPNADAHFVQSANPSSHYPKHLQYPIFLWFPNGCIVKAGTIGPFSH